MARARAYINRDVARQRMGIVRLPQARANVFLDN